MDAVGRLVERAQDAGALRRDLAAKDVLALIPAASLYPRRASWTGFASGTPPDGASAAV